MEKKTIIPSAHGPQTKTSPATVIIAIGVTLVILYLARLVLITIFTSVLLAFVLEPIVDRLQRAKVPRPLGAFMALLLMLGVLYGITYFSYNRATEFVKELPKYTEKIRNTIGQFQRHAERLQQTTANVLPDSESDSKTITVQQKTSWSEALTRSAATVTEMIFVIGFMPFLIYFMLTWTEHVRAATVMLFSMQNRNTAYVTLGQISLMMRSFIVGNFIVGMFLALVSFLVFLILQLPYPYFIGFISGFLSLVPYLGVVLAMVPPIVAGLGHIGGGEVLAIVLTVLGLHVFALNVLYPKLIGRRLQLNPLVVTLSLLVWGWMWGAMGLILAVPITGAMKVIFDHIEGMRAYGAWLGE